MANFSKSGMVMFIRIQNIVEKEKSWVQRSGQMKIV